MGAPAKQKEDADKSSACITQHKNSLEAAGNARVVDGPRILEFQPLILSSRNEGLAHRMTY